MTTPVIAADTQTETSETETTAAEDAPVEGTEAASEAATADATVQAPADEEALDVADGLKEGVAANSETAGNFIETLDAAAIQLGDMRVSLWDGLVVAAVITLVIAGAWLINKLSKNAISRASRFDDTQKLLAEKLVTILIWAGAFFVGIDMLGIDLTALAVFSGAFGLAIGFGLQKTFGNLIAGIILLMDKSIKPGDVIAVTDAAGNERFGQIRKIGIRAVSVTTRDQREYLIPNENLMVNQVENWSYSSRNVRMQVPVGVSYDADMDKAEELMLEAAKATNRVLQSPAPTIWMSEYGDNSVNFVIHCWIRDPEAGVGNVRSAVLKNLWKLFKDNDIEIPFPQRDLHIRSSKQMDQLIEVLSAKK
jgi:small-conductance mechanosensitive channel